MNFIDIAHAQEMTASQEAAPATGGVLSSLGINGTLFLAQLINFAIIAAILWFLILKPLAKTLKERSKIIDDSIANAKRVDENLRRSETEFQKRVDDAKMEASKIVEKAAGEAESVVAGMKTKAKEEIEVLVTQAKRNITVEKEEMIQGIREEAATLVTKALEKILSEKMTDAKDQKMIEEMVKKLQ